MAESRTVNQYVEVSVFSWTLPLSPCDFRPKRHSIVSSTQNFLTTEQISTDLAQICCTDYTRQIIAKQRESASPFSGEMA